MTPQFQKLLDEARQLSAAERIAIAGELLEMTSGENADDDEADFHYQVDLAAEVQRREAELISGHEQAISHATAMELMFGKDNE
jgi:hypothetical protein